MGNLTVSMDMGQADAVFLASAWYMGNLTISMDRDAVFLAFSWYMWNLHGHAQSN